MSQRSKKRRKGLIHKSPVKLQPNGEAVTEPLQGPSGTAILTDEGGEAVACGVFHHPVLPAIEVALKNMIRKFREQSKDAE